MRFIRRSATGYYLPQKTRQREYGYWDDFNRANGNITGSILGPNNQTMYWQGFGGGTPPPTQISSNQLAIFANVNAWVPRYVSGTSNTDTVLLTDQYSQLTFKADSGTGTLRNIGLCLRVRGAAGGTSIPDGYYAFYRSSDGGWQIGAFFNGGLGGFGLSAGGSGTTSTPSPGDVIKFTAVGFHPTTLTLYRNNVSFGTCTMGALPLVDHDLGCYQFGAPGIGHGGGTDGGISWTLSDDWQGGSLISTRTGFNDNQGSGYWSPQIPPPS